MSSVNAQNGEEDASNKRVRIEDHHEEEEQDEENDNEDGATEVTSGDLESRGDHTEEEREADNESVGEAPPPRPEPSYKKASSTKFFTICRALEDVWQANKDRKRWPIQYKCYKIIPPKYMEWLAQREDENQPPESIFPLMRLLMPEKDASRQCNMKEKSIAAAYSGALKLAKTSLKHKQLVSYHDPNIAVQGFSDLSLVVQNVVGEVRLAKASDFTIADINKFLDDAAAIPQKARAMKSSHDWRKTPGMNKPKTGEQLRAEWVRRLNTDTPQRRGLSPLENKWLVRILLQRLQIGIGWEKLMEWYNPYGAKLWSAHNSLKAICNTLCDPEFSRTQGSTQTEGGETEGGETEEEGGLSYMAKSPVTPQFGVPINPMLSVKTGFGRLLDDLSKIHRDNGPENVRDFLSFQHPTFTVETKLDGERMLVHIARDGVVKMNTRKGNWYSELYSPILGPALRSSVQKWDFDIILDGEVLSWDSVRQETIYFGNNRGVAKRHQRWMEEHGGIDKRDKGIHEGDKDFKSMDASNTLNDRNMDIDNIAGEECWLQYQCFDVLYVDGPGASDFLSQAVSSHITPCPVGGAIVHLDGFERKKILYKLIEPQKNKVEIVKTWIVRPNGRTVVGDDYFSPESPAEECGYPAYTLDSLSCTLAGTVPGLRQIDQLRRRGLSDEQISQARAQTLQNLYNSIVEEKRMEGLVIKDLSAPYFLGDHSREFKYWHKFKPDYFNGSAASDLDVIIIGAYFATGMRDAGSPSSLLCGCVDSKDHEKFFTLCKVNLGSVDSTTRSKLLGALGFSSKDGSVDYGKFFPGDLETGFIPDFISHNSHQSGNEDGSWRYKKEDYPDMWIHPSDARILTLNAGEIVRSDTFSAGLTLRFPRITKVRNGPDDKDPSHIESELSLWRTFNEVEEQRSSRFSDEATFEVDSSVNRTSSQGPCRFLTESQYAESKKTKRRKNAKRAVGVSVGPKVTEVESTALSGLTFVVLDGIYALEDGSIDMAEAREQGWVEEGLLVKNATDVKTFIKRHGGRCIITPDGNAFVVGGSAQDARVLAHIQAIQNARAQSKGVAKTKKAILKQKIAKNAGVLRWTFVYSLVHRWLSRLASKDEGTKTSIQETDAALLRQTVLDFLARPRQPVGAFGVEDELLDVELTSVTMMQRALDFVRPQSIANDGEPSSIEAALPWQLEAFRRLNANERWVMSSGHQTLWPDGKGTSAPSSRVVLYPDVFDYGFGSMSENESEADVSRWNGVTPESQSGRIAAVLPLARIMGAFVSFHLHYGVTHVLCDLSDEVDSIEFANGLPERVFAFAYRERGNRLLCRLKALHENQVNHAGVLLVSPNWIRKRKWQEHTG